MESLRNIARTIFDRALADCDIERVFRHHMSVQDGILHLGAEEIELSSLRRIRIVAAGKAARTMLTALLKQLAHVPALDVGGILIAPESASPPPSGFLHFAGGHPLPNEASFAGARAALAMLQSLPIEPTDATLCFFLISGGASAMMELPFDPVISLSDTIEFHRVLVGSGATITEINCVRKHFSAVKGGRLAIAASSAMNRSLLISDVPGGREDSLASGPTLPDPSTVAECREILERYSLYPHFPPSVRQFFRSASLPETPKPGTFQSQATVLLDSQALADAAARHAKSLGFVPRIDNSCDEWEYRQAARYLLGRLRTLRNQQPNPCLISVGEVSVSLPASGKHLLTGVGGRNQQFVLYAATLLTPKDRGIAVLSAGSDGIDGNSLAAGAVLDEMSLSAQGDMEAACEALGGFDAANFLHRRGLNIVTGPTGNNLRDLRILLSR